MINSTTINDLGFQLLNVFQNAVFSILGPAIIIIACLIGLYFIVNFVKKTAYHQPDARQGHVDSDGNWWR